MSDAIDFKLISTVLISVMVLLIFVDAGFGRSIMSKKNKVKKATLSQITPAKYVPLLGNLEAIAEKRTGGAVNIVGITYQTLYATYILLREFSDKATETLIRLEGLEDLDLQKGKLTLNDKELIQLKSSINSLDAAGFWEMGVLKNFLEVYRLDRDLKYRFVHNMSISAGFLKNLVANDIRGETFEHWANKIKTLPQYYSDLVIEDLLGKMTFEHVSAETLYGRSLELLLDKFNINLGTELQYLKSIFYHALEWSKDRSTIDYTLFRRTLQDVTDAFNKGTVNSAVANGWITSVKFDADLSINTLEYFEGKAAHPQHIVQQLPARRPVWEKQVTDLMAKTDIVVIKSSSGQGKSTLAWQTAYNLSSNHSVYQLQHAQLAAYTGPIIDFITSRVLIGELPLIILDGLDQQLQHWTSVVRGVSELPVKFIVTAREEDWYVFSNDLSRINIQICNISLGEEEAKNIYQQLKARNKVHLDNYNWQTAWEKIKDKGLLIEYTYLLTKGEMISERLAQQIKKLNSGERNSGAKIELLRMIGLADILGLKVKSKALTQHVQQVAGITGDRGELFKELEREYFIKIGEQYVEGLHPVRSAHLVQLLHEYVDIQDSLISLFHLLEPTYYDHFAHTAIEQVRVSGKSEFLKAFAGISAAKSLTDIVAMIDGLMKREPQRYWEANRKVFDDVFENGGIEIFIVDTLPFTHLNMISNLQQSFGEEYRNPSVLQQKLDILDKYDFQKSDVAEFIHYLQEALNKVTLKDRSGLASLLKWVNKVDTTVELPFEIDESDLKNVMLKGTLMEAHEVFYYFRKNQPDRYQRFVDTNKKDLLSWLKTQTDTAVVEERDGNLYLKYIFDPDKLKLNEQSVERIERFHALLPGYGKYCTDLIYLPFPTDDLYKVFRIDAHKTISPDNLYDPFEVQINQSWSIHILKNYEAQSVYDWQNQLVKLRKAALDFVKKCTQFFEFLAEQNEQRKNAAIQPLIRLGGEVLQLIRTRLRFPDQKQREEEPNFKKQSREIDEWGLGVQNFINQFSGIVLDQPNHHIAVINLKKMVLKLTPAQSHFHNIAGASIRYFELIELESDEISWYQRLRATVEYFITHRKESVRGAKEAVKSWWQNEQAERLAVLTEGLRILSEPTSYVFLAPGSISEDEYGRTAVIGVSGLPDDPKQLEDAVFNMIWTLVPLSSLDILTYDVILFKGTIATGAFRIQKTYLETLLHLNDTGEFEASEFGNPIPIVLEPETVAFLPGISIPDISTLNITQDFSKVVIDLWRFQQYRLNLEINNSYEKEWLERLKEAYKQKITALMPLVKSNSVSDHEVVAAMIDKVIVQDKDLSTEAYLAVLNNKVADVNNNIQRMIAKGSISSSG